MGGGVGDLIQISRILLYFLCGLYGGREIIVLLKMWSARQLKFKHPTLVLFMNGLLYRVSLIATLFIPS